MMLLPLMAHAYMREIDGMFYDLDDSGKTAKVVNNPSLYTGEVTIPDAIVYEEVVYKVTSIGEQAFRDCTGLASVKIGANVTEIQSLAFYGCTQLESVVASQHLTSILYGAFTNCSHLRDFIIPSGVTCIDSYTFQGCSSLTAIDIPSGVTTIGSSAFEGCSGLTSITIPSSVRSIGTSALADCNGLTSIRVESGNARYDSRNNCNAIIETASNKLIVGCANSVIPQGVAVIDDGAFHNDILLTSITIPNSVTSIGMYAFEGCSNLTFVSIGTGITDIGYKAFAKCPNISDVYCYAANVPVIGLDAFSAFSESNPENITLHVQNVSVDAYRAEVPWSGFKEVIGIGQNCATPTILFVDGKLKFECDTEGVEFVYEITESVKDSGTGSEVKLGNTTTYRVSVYATKEGYENSEVATKDVTMSVGLKGDVNDDGKIDVEDVVGVVNIILDGNE